MDKELYWQEYVMPWDVPREEKPTRKEMPLPTVVLPVSGEAEQRATRRGEADQRRERKERRRNPVALPESELPPVRQASGQTVQDPATPTAQAPHASQQPSAAPTAPAEARQDPPETPSNPPTVSLGNRPSPSVSPQTQAHPSTLPVVTPRPLPTVSLGNPPAIPGSKAPQTQQEMLEYAQRRANAARQDTSPPIASIQPPAKQDWRIAPERLQKIPDLDVPTSIPLRDRTPGSSQKLPPPEPRLEPDTSTFADLGKPSGSLPKAKEHVNQSQDSFPKAQVEYDLAAERMLAGLTDAVIGATRRIEELERRLEMTKWE